MADALERVASLERALESSRHIGTALGILIERHKLTEDEAFRRLVAISQHRNIKVRELAERLLRTGNLDD